MNDLLSAEPARVAVPKKPGLWGYGVAVLLLLLGLGVFLAAVLPERARMHAAVAGLQRVVIPQGGAFAAEGPGTVTLYYEKRSEVEGKRYETAMRWDDTPLRIEDSAGNALEIVAREGTVVYAVLPFAAESFATVVLPGSGTYTLKPLEDSANTGEVEPRVIAIGHVPVELFEAGIRGIYGGAVVSGLAFTASILLVLITWARRCPRDEIVRRCRRGR